MSYQDAKDAMYSWAVAVLPAAFTVAFTGNPSTGEDGDDGTMASSPTPPEPYCVVEMLLSGAPVGDDDSWTMEDDLMVFDGARRLTTQFRLVADEAGQYLDDLRAGFNKPSTTEILKTGGVAFVRELNAIDGSTIQRHGWRRRAQMDVELRYSHTYTDDPGYIETGSFESTLESDGSIESSEDIDLGD